MSPVLKYHDGTAWTEVGTAGPAGPPGPVGDTGPAGATGPAIDTTNLVQKSGDTMTGPLVVPVPTLITQVGRWAEGTPRFATPAERDTAYGAIGGPVDGMRCVTTDESTTWIYRAGAWQWESDLGGRYMALALSVGTPLLNQSVPTVIPFDTVVTQSGAGMTFVNNGVQVRDAGTYEVIGRASIGMEAVASSDVYVEVRPSTKIFARMSAVAASGWVGGGTIIQNCPAGETVQVAGNVWSTNFLFGTHSFMSVRRLS